MSTSENPETPPLTRRQLRELRNTGATPIITPQFDAPPADDTDTPSTPEPEQSAVTDAAPSTDSEIADTPVADESAADASLAEPEPAPKKGGMLGGLFGRGKADKVEDAAATEEPAPAEDAPSPVDQTAAAVVPEQPLVPASFPPADGADLGVTGLTRRQARAQERIRTASVPIITPDLQPGFPAPRDEANETPEAADVQAPNASETAEPVPAAGASVDGENARGLQAIFRPAASDEPSTSEPSSSDDDAVSTVNPALGSDLLNGQTPEISLPPSFDQLISRSAAATGSVSTPNALILSQTPAGVPLVGPVTSTGEVLITGTFELPEGLGSAGHVPGTTDGRDVDAVLLDGELPAASSPTPIAASAAISTVKQPGEIIRPPAPEKGSKLVVGLIITTGALAVAVAVALVLAFTTGVFG